MGEGRVVSHRLVIYDDESQLARKILTGIGKQLC